MTWLQGGHLIPTAIDVIELTYDPVGTPAVSSWSPVGRWDSAEELLADWMAVLEADIGPGFSAELVEDLDAHAASLKITTPGQPYNIAWGLHTGLRDYLGETAAVSGRASEAVWPGTLPATFYCRYGTPDFVRSSTGVPRTHRVRLDGSSEVLHAADVAEALEVDLGLTLRFGPDPAGAVDYQGHYQLERCISAMLDPDRGGFGVCSLWHQGAHQSSGDRWVLRLAEPVVVHPERVLGSRPDRLWDVRLSVIGEVCPW